MAGADNLCHPLAMLCRNFNNPFGHEENVNLGCRCLLKTMKTLKFQMIFVL
jgi:hypothetical protein